MRRIVRMLWSRGLITAVALSAVVLGVGVLGTAEIRGAPLAAPLSAPARA